jgi:hypothetical protein
MSTTNYWSHQNPTLEELEHASSLTMLIFQVTITLILQQISTQNEDFVTNSENWEPRFWLQWLFLTLEVVGVQTQGNLGDWFFVHPQWDPSRSPAHK